MIRRPGEAANAKFTACCLVPVSLPFILMPLFFLSVIWMGNQDMNLLGKVLITLFVSIFLVVGLGLAWAGLSSSLKAMGYGAKASKVEPGGLPQSQDPAQFTWWPKGPKTRSTGIHGGIRIPAESTAMGQAIFMGIFSLVWNAIVGPICYMMFFNPKKDQPFFAEVIVGLLALAGLFLLWSAIHSVLRVVLTGETFLDLASEPVSPGQTVNWAVVQKGNFEITQASAKLVCRETVRYTVGTDTVTRQETVRTIELGPPKAGQADVVRPIIQGQLTLPADAPPTFVMPNNRIEWGVEVILEIPNRPDVKAFFPVRVLHSEKGF